LTEYSIFSASTAEMHEKATDVELGTQIDPCTKMLPALNKFETFWNFRKSLHKCRIEW